jgi:uncharacterized protein (DUF2252 family)
MTASVWERITKFNQDQERDSEKLKLKYKAMRQSSFVFFRGTCHLFYQDWPENSPLNAAPPSWICGDLHLENFGSYKGDNRLVYFDINDFDEAILAPNTWETARFLTSVLVGAQSLGVNQPEAIALCHCYLDAYFEELKIGKARWVETETSEGMVKDLLASLKSRRRRDFLDSRTEIKKGKRQLKIDNKKQLAVTAEQRSLVAKTLADWAAKQPNPEFFKLLDIAQRIAGTGSLGLSRYILLVEGKGSPHENYFLDLKESPRSSLQHYVKLPQPIWENEAARAIAIQTRAQGTSPAMIAALEMVEKGQKKSYILRELQPSQDKISLELWNGKLRRLQKVLTTMGKITAWDQLRSGGRQGSAIADELITFAENSVHWENELLSYAQAYAVKVETDFEEFSRDYNLDQKK